MGEFRVTFFGRFWVEYDRQPLSGLESQKAQELFAYLLIYHDRPHFREKLATVLWENSAPSQAKGYLRQSLWQLQTALSAPDETEELLRVDSEWMQANQAARLWLDVAQFEHAFASVKGVPGKALEQEQVSAVKEAVDLYQGDLLESWYQDWCLLERERLQNIYLALLDKLLSHCEACRDYESGIEYAARLLNCDLAHERTYRRLMRLHALTGDRTGALRTYQRCAAALQEELGVAPGPETRDLHRQIVNGVHLTGEEGRSGDAAPPASSRATSLLRLLQELTHLRNSLFDMQQQIEQDIESLKSTVESNR